MAWNIFRILGDLSHLVAKCVLLVAIHSNRSAEGVSLITQILYAVVFCTRYLDLFQNQHYLWNVLFKIFYITSSFYTIAIMRWVFPRSREKEIAWKMGGASVAACLVLSPFIMMIFEEHWGFQMWLWVFSQMLESVAVLPQLVLLRQTTTPTVIDSFYLVALGSYRALYCLNWIWRELDINGYKPDAVSVIFGIIQTALYVDFAWVYYTRQRVKLRGGGVVDADDIRRGWLLNRIFGRHIDDEDDEENAPALGAGGARGASGGGAARGSRAKWGARGISISADDTTLEREGQEDGFVDGPSGEHVDPDARMRDPDELAMALADDDDDDDAPPPPPSKQNDNRGGEPTGVGNGAEWRDS